jgi:hypothetical protein
MTTLERVPDTWDSDRDEPFFRITARLLPGAFVAAASALLASYDDEPARVSVGARRGPGAGGPSGRSRPRRVRGAPDRWCLGTRALRLGGP